jgi:hypothetical protein
MRTALFLIAVTMVTHVYGHDVTRSVFSDETTLKRFLAATDLTAQRLFLKPDVKYGDQWQLGGYTRGEAKVIPETETKELRSLFTTESSFLWHSEPKNGAVTVKPCIPDYGVLLTFQDSAGAVSIALCFECDLFAVFRNGARVNEEEDFDRIRSQLVALVKRLFPQDAAIQGLTESAGINLTNRWSQPLAVPLGHLEMTSNTPPKTKLVVASGGSAPAR